MSHFSEVKTNLKQSATLKRALQAMGYQLECADEGVHVRGFFGETQPAEFKILTDTHYDIGFQKNESGNYELVGDWELLPKVSGIEQESFIKKLKRQYAKTAITELAQEKGYVLEINEDEATQTIEMVVSQ